MSRFAYKLPGWFVEYGPVEAADLDDAKAEIRRRLGVSRLPPGIQVWDLSARPMVRYRVTQEPILVG